MKVLRKGDRCEEVKVLQKALHLVQDGIFGVITDEAVRAFQRNAGLFPDGIVGPKTWVALKIGEPLVIKKSRRLITEIIVHCTATLEGDTSWTVDKIREAHKKNGWADIGYHYVVYIDGSIHNGRDVDLVGAHVSGRNANSIGVVYIGGLESSRKGKDTRTPEQKEALITLLKQLRKLYPSAKILGHRDCSRDLNGNGTVEPFEWVKECPCFYAKTEYKNI